MSRVRRLWLCGGFEIIRNQKNISVTTAEKETIWLDASLGMGRGGKQYCINGGTTEH